MFLNYFISCQRNMNNTSWLLVLKLSRGILGWMISSLLHLILETRFYYSDKQLCDHQSSLEMDTPKIPNGKWKHHLEIGMGTCDSFRSRFSSNRWRTLSCINFILVNLAFSHLVFTITGKQVVELASVYVCICRKRYLRRSGVSVLWLRCSYLFAPSFTLRAAWKPGVLKVALTWVSDCFYPNTMNSVFISFCFYIIEGWGSCFHKHFSWIIIFLSPI